MAGRPGPPDRGRAGRQTRRPAEGRRAGEVRPLRGRPPRERSGHRLDRVHGHRRGQRAAGDRLDLVRAGVLAHRGQHRVEAAPAHPRLRGTGHGPRAVEDRTTSTTAPRRPSPASARAARVCCAATSGARTAPGGTRCTSPSSPRSGPRPRRFSAPASETGVPDTAGPPAAGGSEQPCSRVAVVPAAGEGVLPGVRLRQRELLHAARAQHERAPVPLVIVDDPVPGPARRHEGDEPFTGRTLNSRCAHTHQGAGPL